MKIAILSRNPSLYSTKRLFEAGKQRGHEMIILDHQKCVLVIEQGKPKIVYGGHDVIGVDAIIPRIGASVTFYGAAVVRQFEQRQHFQQDNSLIIFTEQQFQKQNLPFFNS